MTRRRLIVIALMVFSITLLAERTKLKPKTNSAPKKDIDMGLQVSKDAEKELVLIKNPEVNSYITALGNSLVARAPNDNHFPFTFKVVDDKDINAFALPGGPVYVNRGAIEAADNEAQIAGVIGHESGHVILRHGMAQQEKAEKISIIPALGGLIFGNGTAGKIASGVGSLGANSLVLRYSRDAESEADLMGTQILYDCGYDPMAMAEFFDKLAKEHKGTKTEQFFSNHPIPENRIVNVKAEIMRLGPAVVNPKTDTDDFQRVKKILLAMPEPAKPKPADTTITAAPPLPSSHMSDLQFTGLTLRYPDNWKPSVQGTNVTLIPPGGASDKGDIGYGMLIDVFKPTNTRSLDQATSQLISGLLMDNPNMKIARQPSQVQIGGQPARMAELSNSSPAGGPESDFIFTVLRPNGLQFFVQVAPTKSVPQYENAFRNVMDSVRFR